MRRRRQRNVALAAQQARGRIEPDPAGARQIDFGPGVQVGEVLVGAGGPVERLEIGLELNEVARHETRGQADVAEDLHHQPRAVAARAGRQRQRLLGRLHARLHADDVANVALQLLI